MFLLRLLTVAFSTVLPSSALALNSNVTIETHMEVPESQRGEISYKNRCKVIDKNCSQDYFGKKIFRPVYPSKMYIERKAAFCVADISLSSTGMVSQVNDVICKPNKSEFRRSVRKAVKKYEFYPKIIKGEAVPVRQAILKFHFQLEI